MMQSPRFTQSISFRLYLIILPVTALAVAAYGLLNAHVTSRMLETQVERSTAEVAAQLAEDLGRQGPLDPERLHTLLEELAEGNFFISRIEVFHLTGKELTRTATTSATSSHALILDETIAVQQNSPMLLPQYQGNKRFIKAIAPIGGASGSTGCVSITSSLHQAYMVRGVQQRLAIYLIPASVLLLILLLHYLFTRGLTRRIDQLSHAMTEARRGNLKMRAPVARNDELGIIAARFNEAMDEIERATAEKERFIQQEKNFNVELQAKVQDATRDLTSANARLRQLNQDLIETQRLLMQYERMAVAGQMAATFAHEIGSPLSAMTTHLELMSEHPGINEDIRRRIGLVQDQLGRISGFVEDLLAETRASVKARSPIQVNQVIKQLLLFLEQHFDKCRIRVAADLDPALPEIEANAQQLQQVFLNLLNNACDALPQGGNVWIETGVEYGPEASPSAVVTVSDDGPGIPVEKQTHIFEPFFSTRDLKHGTGLGLSIVARIVREHQGTIELESAESKGTTFRIRFPAAVQPSPAVRVKG